MKYALIIGSNKYNDQKLAQLKTPAADSQALARILDDKTIGSFDEVTPLINQTESQVRRAISTFLTGRKPDDLVLLYFSGHGVLDDRGRLYLALRDTQVNLLKATSIPSSFVADEMDSCRSKRQILILDCCNSGAFARGTKGEQKAVTETTFEGSGFGRVVLTASDSTQYALEGDQVIKQTELSLFTHFLLEGLKTGEADTNNDGHISLDEWYDYTYGRVVSETPRQVPHKWSYNQQGDLVIARNPHVKKKVVELPHELVQALESSFVGIRESAVNELGKYLGSREPEMADLAVLALAKMKEDDSRRISSLAERLLSEFEQTRTPARKATPAKTPAEGKPETADVINAPLLPSVQMTAETELPSGTETRALQPEIENRNLPLENTSFPKALTFDSSFWLKWAGTTVLAVVFSSLLYIYNISMDDSSLMLVPFGMIAGVASLMQWLVFQNRLAIWWVGANAVTGLFLGWQNNYLYNNSSWGLEHLGILLGIWIIGNFALGLVRVGKIRESSMNLAPFVESGARRNIFLTLLSPALVLAAAANFSLALGFSGLLKVFWILYGVTAILTGIAFVLKKETPRTIGFIALAVFLLLDGINVFILAFDPEYPLYFFALNALTALVSGIFFISRRETWKHMGFVLLSGFLLSTAVAGINVYTSAVNTTFLVISAVIALPAAIFLFTEK